MIGEEKGNLFFFLFLMNNNKNMMSHHGCMRGECDGMVILERYRNYVSGISEQEKKECIKKLKERYQEVKTTWLNHGPVKAGHTLVVRYQKGDK
jgi:hypothetical protein